MVDRSFSVRYKFPMKNKISGIYWIISPSGRAYIGSSCDINSRRRNHIRNLQLGSHHCQALQRAWVKYDGQLRFEIIQFCDNDKLFLIEQFWFDNHWLVCNGLYNSSKIADCGKFSEQGLKNRLDFLSSWKMSDESKEKIRQTLSGRPHSQERKDKISKTLTGVKLSPERIETCRRIAKERYEQNVNFRGFPKGYVMPDDVRKKISKTQKDRHEKGQKTSEYRGVCLVNNAWLAYLNYKARRYVLGKFKTEKLAAIAYNEKLIELGVDPKRLNIIKD